MDPEIVCIAKQGSPDFTECRFDVDSIAVNKSAATASAPEVFSANSSVSGSMMEHSKSQETNSRQECSAGQEMDELDQTPSPNELLNTYNSGISLILENEELWSKFREVHTEMIITKSGR